MVWNWVTNIKGLENQSLLQRLQFLGFNIINNRITFQNRITIDKTEQNQRNLIKEKLR